MTNVLERLSPGARVAVIRLRSLGDCVLTTPAIALLKQARPDLRIAMVVEDGFAAVFVGNPDLESILPSKASEISRWRPDLTLNLHGGITSVRLTLSARSRWRAGFAHFRFRAVYNIQIPRAQEILHVDRKVHSAEHVASAMFYLGVPLSDIPRARLFAEPSPNQRPYAVLHPMASTPDKTWPSSNFLAVAEHLDKRLGLEPVFIAGPGEGLDAFSSYRCLAGAPLEETKSLLAGASLFIGNDSGPAHMAAAFGLPVVVLFGSSDPEIWRPWRTESMVLANPEGIRSIGVSEVAQAIETVFAPQPTPHIPQPVSYFPHAK
jgi:ADP-heptose:LPS heptosyltransferase